MGGCSDGWLVAAGHGWLSGVWWLSLLNKCQIRLNSVLGVFDLVREDTHKKTVKWMTSNIFQIPPSLHTLRMTTKRMTNHNNQWVPPFLRKEWQINALKRFQRGKRVLHFGWFLVTSSIFYETRNGGMRFGQKGGFCHVQSQLVRHSFLKEVGTHWLLWFVILSVVILRARREGVIWKMYNVTLFTVFLFGRRPLASPFY